MPKRFVIVGNGIAGTTCAETLRAEDPTCSVTLVGLEPYPLYNRVSLPRYLKGMPKERVMLRTVEQHKERGIDLRLERVATGLDTAGKTVQFDDGSELPYDALMICTGGRPLPFPAPGADQVRELTYGFQTLDDTDAIIEKGNQSTDSVVVGGSFIAYELAEGFRHRGLNTTWIQRGPWFLRRVLDEQGGKMVDFLAKEAGVETVYNEEIASVAPANGHMTVHTKGGRDLRADMLGYGLGLEMYDEWLEGTGIKVDKGIVVDEYLETSVPGIFAGGDIARFVDLMLDGQYNQMGTWDNAEEHGQVAALNMLGRVPRGPDLHDLDVQIQPGGDGYHAGEHQRARVGDPAGHGEPDVPGALLLQGADRRGGADRHPQGPQEADRDDGRRGGGAAGEARGPAGPRQPHLGRGSPPSAPRRRRFVGEDDANLVGARWGRRLGRVVGGWERRQLGGGGPGHSGVGCSGGGDGRFRRRGGRLRPRVSTAASRAVHEGAARTAPVVRQGRPPGWSGAAGQW